VRPGLRQAAVTLGAVAVGLVLLPAFMPGGTLDLYPFAGARFPFHAGFIDLATTVLIFSLFALGFNLLFGHTGELSFGHAMFFSLAAYSTALYTHGYDLTFLGHAGVYEGNNNLWVTLVISLVVVTVVATAIAHLVVPRSSGIYYSMITLAFAQAIYFVTFHWGDLTGGEDGLQSIARPHLPGFDASWLMDATHTYIFTAAITFVAVALNYWIVQSRFGSVLHAIRENKQRARFLGYDVNKYRINAFVLSALFPGLGGWLWTYFQQAINPDAGSVDYSGRVVMMSLLGGIHSFAGPILGAAVYWDMQNRVSLLTKYWPAAIGLTFALFVIFVPGGITGLVKLLRNRFAKEKA